MREANKIIICVLFMALATIMGLIIEIENAVNGNASGIGPVISFLIIIIYLLRDKVW